MSMTPQAAKAFHCPRWEELPEIDLYMDQVVLLLDKVLGPLGDPGEPVVTSTMINNYVKKKLVAAPIKKKYGRGQLAALIVLSVLKRALSIPEIACVMDAMRSELGDEAAYDTFCATLEDTLFTAYSDMPVPFRREEFGVYPIMDAALTAWIGKMMLRDQIAASSAAKAEGEG